MGSQTQPSNQGFRHSPEHLRRRRVLRERHCFVLQQLSTSLLPPLERQCFRLFEDSLQPCRRTPSSPVGPSQAGDIQTGTGNRSGRGGVNRDQAQGMIQSFFPNPRGAKKSLHGAKVFPFFHSWKGARSSSSTASSAVVGSQFLQHSGTVLRNIALIKVAMEFLDRGEWLSSSDRPSQETVPSSRRVCKRCSFQNRVRLWASSCIPWLTCSDSHAGLS